MRQAQRHDANGDYVRRYVPELADLPGGAAHEPWRAPSASVAPEYPRPLARVA
jgi:deoxyribodipyrimidine photo-lyase